MEPIGGTTERIGRLEQIVQSLKQENQAMADRLARAEQQGRTRRYFLWFLSVAGVFTILTARAVNTVDTERPKTIEAERFILRDKDGNTRAALHMTPEQYAELDFYDCSGNYLFHIYALNFDNTGINVFGKRGNVRLGIGSDQNGGVGMAIYDGDGKKRADFGMTKSGSTLMGIFDRDGMIRIEDFVRANGTAERLTAPTSPVRPMKAEENHRERSEGG